MNRPSRVEDWIEIEASDSPDGSWLTMMSRVAAFHHKHDFASEENNGHDMGYRVALTVEELGEFAAAITHVVTVVLLRCEIMFMMEFSDSRHHCQPRAIW